MPAVARRQFVQGSPAVAGLSLLWGCGILPPQAQPLELHAEMNECADGLGTSGE